jgi:nucleoside-diphosphate-sugar epimerase
MGNSQVISLRLLSQLVDIVAEIAGKRMVKRFDHSKPKGGRGRNNDNSQLRKLLGWEPKMPLREGLIGSYRWIETELRKKGRISEVPSAHTRS